MNYAKIYTALTDRGHLRFDGVSRKAAKASIPFYVERHRIVPGCLGGKYNKSNVSWLTPEEHILAHMLLVKMHPGDDRMVFAASCMSKMDVTGKRMALRECGWLKRKQIEAASRLGQAQMTMNWRNEAFVSKLKEANSRTQKRLAKDPEYRKAKGRVSSKTMSASWANVDIRAKFTEATRLRMSDPAARAAISAKISSLIWITDGVQNRRVVVDVLPFGWRRGKAQRKHCNENGVQSNNNNDGK